MSFDVFLQRFASGKAAEVPRERVQAVLLASSHHEPRKDGFYNVSFSDGLEVEFSARRLFGTDSLRSVAFHLRGLSYDVAAFIFEVAKAGDMVILPAMEEFLPILTSPEQVNELPSDLRTGERQPVCCTSGHQLEVLLSGGYSAWQRYLNQIVKK